MKNKNSSNPYEEEPITPLNMESEFIRQLQKTSHGKDILEKMVRISTKPEE
jgi:hypothetical protein